MRQFLWPKMNLTMTDTTNRSTDMYCLYCSQKLVRDEVAGTELSIGLVKEEKLW
jgi:hypothetical protein